MGIIENENQTASEPMLTHAQATILLQRWKEGRAKLRTLQKNKYNLTPEQVEAMADMTAKEKKQFLKGLTCT